MLLEMLARLPKKGDESLPRPPRCLHLLVPQPCIYPPPTFSHLLARPTRKLSSPPNLCSRYMLQSFPRCRHDIRNPPELQIYRICRFHLSPSTMMARHPKPGNPHPQNILFAFWHHTRNPPQTQHLRHWYILVFYSTMVTRYPTQPNNVPPWTFYPLQDITRDTRPTLSIYILVTVCSSHLHDEPKPALAKNVPSGDIRYIYGHHTRYPSLAPASTVGVHSIILFYNVGMIPTLASKSSFCLHSSRLKARRIGFSRCYNQQGYMVDNMFKNMYLLQCHCNSKVHGRNFKLRLWARSQNVYRCIDNNIVSSVTCRNYNILQ